MDEPALITLDFETHYSTKEKYSLKSLTTEGYVRDPRFQVIGVGVAVGLDPPSWLASSEFFRWAREIDWPKVRCLAHHAHFDGLILNHHFGFRPGFWLDTLSMARELHGVEVGGSLGKLAEHYEIGGKGSYVLRADGKWLSDFTPQEWLDYGQYCCNDVHLTREVFMRMYPEVSAASLRGIDMMVRMFTEPGFVLDIPMLREFHAWDQDHKQRLVQAALMVYQPKPGDPNDLNATLMSNDKFARCLLDLGVEPPRKVSAAKTKTARKKAQEAGLPVPAPIETWAFSKTDPGMQALAEYEEGENAEIVRALVAARLGVKTTINETRASRLLDAGKHGRPVPVYLKWYAAHTGRAGGGDKMNMQNLERVDPTGRDPRKGTLRKSIIAPPGYSLVVVDSAQIEARMLAWVAGAEDTLETFRRNDAEGGDFYADRGQHYFGFPLSKEKTPRERQIAKGLELGLGYQMGWKKCAGELLKGLLGTAPVQFGQTELMRYGVDRGAFEARYGDEARTAITRLPLGQFITHAAVTKHFVDKYRLVNGAVVSWWESMDKLLRIMAADGSGFDFGPDFCLRAEHHQIRLPDESRIRYPGLRQAVEDDGKKRFTYLGRNKSRPHIYGGLMTENLVQGLARVLVFDQALRIQDKLRALEGRVLLTVHDEVVGMVPSGRAKEALTAALLEMRTLPDWCRTLPVAATGSYGQSYGECK